MFLEPLLLSEKMGQVVGPCVGRRCTTKWQAAVVAVDNLLPHLHNVFYWEV